MSPNPGLRCLVAVSMLVPRVRLLAPGDPRHEAPLSPPCKGRLRVKYPASTVLIMFEPALEEFRIQSRTVRTEYTKS